MKPLFDPSKLIFSAEDHSYNYDGRGFVSVTQALSMTGFVDTTHFNDHARQRGTYVHEACCMIDEGTLDWPGLSPELRGYCDAYTHFLKDTDFEVLHSEMPVAHPAYMYAGTLDRIGELNGKLTLIDIKTGAESRVHGLQVRGYSMCLEDEMDLFTLHLRADGTYRLVKYSDKNDSRVFLSAVSCANWIISNKISGKSA